MKRVQQGFTLIELMIVVAIIGILAAVGLPAYQDYTKRAHVSEGLTLASSAKTAVVEYYASEGRFNPTAGNAGYGLPASISGNAVTSVEVLANGVIQITYNGKVASNAVLQLQPTDVNGALTWKCTASGVTGGVDARLLPSSCR
jgi:type IV pilus assembly protein PilA